MAGAIYILPRERVHPVNAPFNKGNKRVLEMGCGR
jgi:hypothetical protein